MPARPSASRLSAPRRTATRTHASKAIESLETRALMSANPWTDALAGLMDARAAVTAPDGSVVVVGTRPGNEVAVARLTPQATLDPTFGVNGIAAARFNGLFSAASDVVLAPDGKIVVSCFVQVMGPPPGDTSDFGVARFNPDGSLDATFGTGGLVTVNLSDGLEAGADAAHTLALDADGCIVVGGSVNYRASVSPVQLAGGFALARLFPDGLLDPTFDEDGQLITLFALPESGPGCSVTCLEILPDGRILATGYRGGPATGTVASVRYNADGSPDVTHGDGGILYTSDPYVDPGITWPAVVPPPAPPPPVVSAAVPRSVAETRLIRRGKFFKFTVTYASQSGAPIDVATVGAGDFTITGPAGFASPVELLRAKAVRRGAVVKATYRAAAPGGQFDRADNGHYALVLAPAAVTAAGDATGTGAAVALGAFYVDCSPPPQKGWGAGSIASAIFSESRVEE